jgi:hypothetical protein
MGETLARPLSVAQARRALSDTSRMSSEQLDELQKIVATFHAARPTNRPCAACGSMHWAEHTTADGDAVWCCAGCSRPSSLTLEAWQEQVAADTAARASRAPARAAAAPKPADALATALMARREAAAALARLEQAQTDARAAVAGAQTRHDAATAAQAERASVALLATNLREGTPLRHADANRTAWLSLRTNRPPVFAVSYHWSCQTPSTRSPIPHFFLLPHADVRELPPRTLRNPLAYFLMAVAYAACGGLKRVM